MQLFLLNKKSKLMLCFFYKKTINNFTIFFEMFDSLIKFVSTKGQQTFFFYVRNNRSILLSKIIYLSGLSSDSTLGRFFRFKGFLYEI